MLDIGGLLTKTPYVGILKRRTFITERFRKRFCGIYSGRTSFKLSGFTDERLVTKRFFE